MRAKALALKAAARLAPVVALDNAQAQTDPVATPTSLSYHDLSPKARHTTYGCIESMSIS